MPDNDGTLNVDVLSLEDFARTLDRRLGEADFLLREITTLESRAGGLGSFPDATAAAGQHTRWVSDYKDRITRLRRAILAAKTATNTIAANYTTAEERNAASARDITSRLAPVDDATGGRS